MANISFQVTAGRVCGLLGSNGAGKTTTMRMILRIFFPDSGEILWNGTPVTDDVRRGFGYLPEERGLYPKMQVREQLIYLTQLKGLDLPEATRRVDMWLDRLELGEYALRRVEQLSKGNQQKVQFVAAAACGPKLCILDEPFTGLDPVNTLVMEQAFRTLAASGCTILFSSHNMDQVESLCQDVVLLHRAHLVLAGNLREIKKGARRQNIQLLMESGEYDFLRQMPGVTMRPARGKSVEITLPAEMDPNLILREAAAQGTVVAYSLGEPSLREIYLEKAGGSHA